MENNELKKEKTQNENLSKKLKARKQLKDLTSEYEYDHKKYTFREFIETKRKSDNKLDEIIKEAELDEKSAASLNDLLNKKEQENDSKDKKEIKKEETNEKNNKQETETKKEDNINKKSDNNDNTKEEKPKMENNKSEANKEIKQEEKNKDTKENPKEISKEEKPETNKENKDTNKTQAPGEEKKESENKPIDPDAPITKFAGEDQKPLKGLVICITGVPIIPKKHFRTLCKRMGAEIIVSVCKKTQILIYGYRIEDGRKYFNGRQYKAAEKAKIQLYSDKDFEKYIQDKLGDKTWTLRDQLPIIKFKGKYNLKQIERLRKRIAKRYEVLDEERFTGVIKKKEKKKKKKPNKKTNKAESESSSDDSDDSDSDSGSGSSK